MKDTYRERIKEEQKKLSPSQVFFSEGYRKLFRDLANEVAGEKLEQLLLYQSTEDGLAGWNDGKRIGINIDNLITGSFLELEQKSDSLIGILGHECGHARFTDSALRKVYVQNMLAGVWYPDAPEPENEDEEKALNEMDTCLAGKNPVVVPLLTECASYISNLLNDVYIEEKMCSLFPGSIKKGILINRRRNVEWIPPLKELLEGNSDPVSVFLKVLVQYALRGYANSWNMESCEMLDTLNEVKQFVDLSVTADSDLIRYQATNQILLKMWKYFRNLLEELKQECQEPEENEEDHHIHTPRYPLGVTILPCKICVAALPTKTVVNISTAVSSSSASVSSRAVWPSRPMQRTSPQTVCGPLPLSRRMRTAFCR